MIINGKNYLLLEKRGCNFTQGTKEAEKSDVGNYRVGAYYHRVKAENGREYILEFSGWDKWQYRKTNKRTGEPLKKPVSVVKLYTGYYKYLCYDIKPGNGRDLVTIYLEEYNPQHIGEEATA